MIARLISTAMATWICSIQVAGWSRPGNLGTARVYLVADANLDGTVDDQNYQAGNLTRFSTAPAWRADGFVDSRNLLLWNTTVFPPVDVNSSPGRSSKSNIRRFG